jgi:hypothetical protein
MKPIPRALAPDQPAQSGERVNDDVVPGIRQPPPHAASPAATSASTPTSGEPDHAPLSRLPFGPNTAFNSAPFTSRDDPASGKDINAIDLARGPEPIEATVESLLRILGLVPISPAEQNSPERASAAVRLQARIEAFVEAQSGRGGSTSKARIQALADVVVAAWTAMVRDEVPRLARSLMVSMLSPGALPLGSAATGGTKA